MHEQFTDRARKIIHLSIQEAHRLHHRRIGTEHILLALVKEGTGVAANVLKNLEIDPRKVGIDVEKIVQAEPSWHVVGEDQADPPTRKVVAFAIAEARRFGHNYVGTEHLLVGLIRERDGVAAKVLADSGADLELVRREIGALLGANGIQAEPQSEIGEDEVASLLESWTKAIPLSDRACKVMQLANQEAHRLNHAYIDTEHFLLGLVKEGSDVAALALQRLGIHLDKARREVERLVPRLSGPVTPGKLPMTLRVMRVIESSSEEARMMGRERVGTDHLLLGLLRENDSMAAQVFRNLGWELATVRDALLHPGKVDWRRALLYVVIAIVTAIIAFKLSIR